MLLTAALTLSSLLCTLNPDTQVPSWPQFRGPQGTGVVAGTHPLKWKTQKNVRWAVDVPGGGWASPVISGDHIFLSTAVGQDGPKGFRSGAMDANSFGGSKPTQALSFELHCLKRSDGSTVWTQVIDRRVPEYPIHASNTYATESPVTDGTHVVAYFGGTGAVACFDFAGNEKWKMNVGAYPTSAGFGTGSSLALIGQHVYLQCDNDQKSFLLALDLATGKEVWRVARKTGTSWSTPLVWNTAGRQELVICGSGNVKSYDPLTGSELWTLTGIDSSFSASPAADRERVYFGNSGPMSSGPLVAVTAGASGELVLDKADDLEHIAWAHRRNAGPGMASPVAHDGLVYVVSRGILNCYDAKTGERVYRERLPDASAIVASPWISQGHLFLLNEAGVTYVVKPGRTFELVQANRLDGLFWSTPAVADGALYIRGAGKLYCIAE